MADTNELTPEAQAVLDQANALFPDVPGRYSVKLLQHDGRYHGHDHSRGRRIGVGADPLPVAQKVLRSAQLSAASGTRRYAEGKAAEPRTVTMLPAQWEALEAYARAKGYDDWRAWLASF